jgi:pimeloyl-ACP methyl ester carboxylesterase
MGSIRKAYGDTPLGQIHYRYAEPNNVDPTKVPILFLHMSASSSASCSRLMDIFASLGYYSYAPDMPGFGQSFDPVENPADIAWYANLYADLFEAMPLFKDGCHLVGHHSGAVIGTQMSVSHSKFIRSLTMVGPALLNSSERNAMRERYLSPFNKPVFDGSHLLATWDYVSDHDKQIPRQEIDLLQRETLDHLRAWKGRSQIYSCVWDYDGISDFREISCPVLALCAKDDVLWPYFHYVHEMRPDVQTGEIVGSNFGLDRGAESIQLLLKDFLAEIGK